MEKLVRDGVRLAFERIDGDRLPIVLIHGWCCDHTYLAPQAAHFAGRGHAVLSIDLRGHGASDAPAGSYAMQVLADDVAALCRERAIGRAAVIGHSMGGMVAFDLAVRHPDLVAGLVMIDSAVARPEVSRAKLPAFIARLRGPEGAAALADYVGGALFLPTDDQARKAAVIAAMVATPRHVMVAALEGMYAFDPEEAAGKLLPPALFVATNGPPLCDLTRLAALVPGLMTAQTAGSGHFAPLEVPDQINAMIARFLAILPSG